MIVLKSVLRHLVLLSVAQKDIQCWMTRTLEALQDEVINVEVSGEEMVEGE